MPFNWADYYVIAETLSRNADEASQRSAISRAYYCVYHLALNHLSEHHNFQYSEGKPAHDQVWREFNNKGISYREIWNKGDRLKKLRVDADYRAEAIINDSTASMAIALAEHIIERLQQLHQKFIIGSS